MRKFRLAIPADADRCFEIESSAFDAGAAATRDKIARRIATYPQGFLVLEVASETVGFVNSGCAREVDLADADFKDLRGHAPDAPNVVVLSVAVDPAHQHRGHATALMREFVARMNAAGKRSIHLICRDHHVGLYQAMGYAHVGPSASTHGGARWQEMAMHL